MQNFKAYPQDISALSEQLAAACRKQSLLREDLQRIYAGMDDILKESGAVGGALRRSLQDLQETGSGFQRQCAALQQVADIYAAAERECLQNRTPATQGGVSPYTGVPLRQAAVLHRDIVVDDWLAELVLYDQLGGKN